MKDIERPYLVDFWSLFNPSKRCLNDVPIKGDGHWSIQYTHDKESLQDGPPSYELGL
jgi:hypothetical protein